MLAPVLLATALAAAPAAAPRWPVAAERLLAADAASYAPSDLKRNLARRRERYMQGVNDAFAAEDGRRTPAEHRAAAARGARAVAQEIRDHQPFEKAFYDLGGVVHELAAALPPGENVDPKTLTASSFAGFTKDAFADPEALVSATLRAGTTREKYDAALTLATRLFAWIWNRAGGDASIAKRMPETEGGYVVREP